MVQCYLCNAEINKLNKSREHIIPNVLGGNITSDKLLCRQCNNGTAELEHKLADQFIFFLSAMDIKRQRGSFPKTRIRTEKNHEVYLCEGLKVKEKIQCNKINAHQIEYTVPDEESAKKVLEQLKGTYPNIDIEKTLFEAKHGEHYLDDKILTPYNIDEQCIAAMCKIMVNYAVYKNYSVGNIDSLVGVINKEKECTDNSEGECGNGICPVKTYSGDSPIIAPNAITCGVGVFGSHTLGKLYGFIQLFNFSKYCVVLDDKYAGENIEDCICFVNDNVEVTPSFSLRVFEENIGKSFDVEQVKTEMRYCIGKIQYKQADREIERICHRGMEKMLKKYPEEEYPYITDEMHGYLCSEIAKGLVKFMVHIGAIKHE